MLRPASRIPQHLIWATASFSCPQHHFPQHGNTMIHSTDEGPPPFLVFTCFDLHLFAPIAGVTHSDTLFSLISNNNSSLFFIYFVFSFFSIYIYIHIIEAQLTCSVSDAQQGDSVIHIHIYHFLNYFPLQIIKRY